MYNATINCGSGNYNYSSISMYVCMYVCVCMYIFVYSFAGSVNVLLSASNSSLDGCANPVYHLLLLLLQLLLCVCWSVDQTLVGHWL